jgi:hypothetical protein
MQRMQATQGYIERFDLEGIPQTESEKMTSELLEANIALSVYRREVPVGLRVCWSGAVDNVQFDILRRGNKVFIAFAGTNEWADMWRHVWVRREKIGVFRGGNIMVHRGWLADFQKCIPIIYAVLREQCADVSTTMVFIGHSYGGSLAQIAAWYLAHEYGMPRVDLRTYGSPRAGNANFAKDLDRRTQSHYRYVVKGDPVTQTPLAFRYKHGGTKILMPFRKSPHSMAGYLKSIRGQTE